MEQQISSEVISLAEETSSIDDTNESIDDIVENAYLEVALDDLNKNENSKTSSRQKFLSDCVLVTKEISDISKKVTLDYGEGCETRRENMVSGKIIIDFSFDIENETVTIDYSFDNFFFNDNKVEGTVHKVRKKENGDGLPETLINREITITWEGGSQSSVSAERKRVMIEGSDTDYWGDNVFEITGTRVLTKRNGVVKTSTIIEPLIRTMACRFITSGVLKIEKNDNEFKFDYGDGSCDSKGFVIKNGMTKEIQIKRRRFKN